MSLWGTMPYLPQVIGPTAGSCGDAVALESGLQLFNRAWSRGNVGKPSQTTGANTQCFPAPLWQSQGHAEIKTGYSRSRNTASGRLNPHPSVPNQPPTQSYWCLLHNSPTRELCAGAAPAGPRTPRRTRGARLPLPPLSPPLASRGKTSFPYYWNARSQIRTLLTSLARQARQNPVQFNSLACSCSSRTPMYLLNSRFIEVEVGFSGPELVEVWR